jgi:hypothetical protein
MRKVFGLFLFLLFNIKAFCQIKKNEDFQNLFMFLNNRLVEIDKNGYRLLSIKTTEDNFAELSTISKSDSVFIEAFFIVDDNVGFSPLDSHLKLFSRYYDFRDKKYSQDSLISIAQESSLQKIDKIHSKLGLWKISAGLKNIKASNGFVQFASKFSVSIEGIQDGKYQYMPWASSIIMYTK